MLVSDDGEQVSRTAVFAGFAAVVANGHELQNRTNRDALVLEVGSRRPDVDAAEYPTPI